MDPFKAYDIRGVYPDEINEKLAYNVARAFVTFLNAKKVAVGYDMRSSSKSLLDSLCRGLAEQGADVSVIGMCATPMLTFSVAHYGFDGGIMISASHNPGKYNAFKLIRKPMLQIGAGLGMEEMEKLVASGKFKEAKKGKIAEKDVMQDYASHICSKFKGIKKMKVVADYGNGVGAISAKPVFRKLGIDAVELYAEPDASFPHHEANPHENANFRDLQAAVKMHKAALGIFFDGDADRCKIVDEDGEIIPADIMFCALMKEELKEHRGEKVYYDLRFTKAAKDIIEESGGRAVMMRVGNPYYKEKLVNEGGFAASEFSGHVMFRENYSIDDGLFAALKVIAMVSKSGKKLSEIVKPLARYHTTPEININVEGKDPDAIMKRVADRFKDGESINLDGVYIQYPDWWFSLRKSNTEPIVRLRVEAATEKRMNEKKSRLLSIIQGQ